MSRSIIAIDVFIRFLGLVLGQSMCRRKFGLIAVVFIFICINPLNAS
jgi:hypothetical protein